MKLPPKQAAKASLLERSSADNTLPVSPAWLERGVPLRWNAQYGKLCAEFEIWRAITVEQ